MIKTNTQRQREYRARHQKSLSDDVEMLERINTMVNFNTKNQLKRLASCYGVTQRALLERLISEATRELMHTLDNQQQNDFCDMKLSLRSNTQKGESETEN